MRRLRADGAVVGVWGRKGEGGECRCEDLAIVEGRKTYFACLRVSGIDVREKSVEASFVLE